MPEMNCVENRRRFDSYWELFTRNTEPVSEMSISKVLSSNPCVSHIFDFNSIRGFVRASVLHLLASSAGECGKERIRTLDSGNISETCLVFILKPYLQISSAYRCLSAAAPPSRRLFFCDLVSVQTGFNLQQSD